MLPNFVIRHRLQEGLLTHAEEQILSVKEAMLAANLGVVEFYGSRKTREYHSQVVGKEKDVASTVFDKLRFRIITKSKEDLMPLMVWLHREVFAYNLSFQDKVTII